jgi:hypothetical protein
VWLVRKTLTSPKTIKTPSQTVLAGLIVKAFNFWREGARPSFLRFNPGGAAPEEFPKINGLDPNDL